MTGKSRLKAYQRGRWAEAAACVWLLLQGFKILERGYRTAAGEIDVIARRGRLLLFVEVKARPSLDLARAAIADRQKRRIERAAAIFLQRYDRLSACDCRFDAILIAPKRWPKHIRDAWRESSN
ncbi:YraN family protein [Denitrobaculum tricleocarpae]|uniref:UPF0102 protein FKG95_14345 n=1 Tax=Denitrobaculum tricleocarpae TaxID=2591009 RepID=A0A545TRM5_9PROT|nr:YraN family protein [Denitrobaculum tricleocarpae]TQV79866.1 YraN family protein [Denitrobaculum tricleocarpae]